MIKRSVMSVDAMLAQLSMLCNTWRAEFGQDLNQVEMPVSEIVFDVLKAIGIPDNGVGLVLQFTGKEEGEQQLPCSFCEEPAAFIAQAKREPVLVCAKHSADATQQGWQIFPYPKADLEL